MRKKVKTTALAFTLSTLLLAVFIAGCVLFDKIANALLPMLGSAGVVGLVIIVMTWATFFVLAKWILEGDD